jgi:hypothetical protein
MKRAQKDAMAAAAVLGARIPMLWAMSFDPTPARRTEAARMVNEKTAAFAIGAMRAQQQMFTEAMGFWLRAARGTLSPFDAADATSRVMASGAAPARASMKANARRLAKRGPI